MDILDYMENHGLNTLQQALKHAILRRSQFFKVYPDGKETQLTTEGAIYAIKEEGVFALHVRSRKANNG